MGAKGILEPPGVAKGRAREWERPRLVAEAARGGRSRVCADDAAARREPVRRRCQPAALRRIPPPALAPRRARSWPARSPPARCLRPLTVGRRHGRRPERRSEDGHSRSGTYVRESREGLGRNGIAPSSGLARARARPGRVERRQMRELGIRGSGLGDGGRAAFEARRGQSLPSAATHRPHPLHHGVCELRCARMTA
jgi:hypothetical protein